MKTKIHYTGYPCKIQSKTPYKSIVLASNSNPERVTCKTCISICTKIAAAWLNQKIKPLQKSH